MKEKLQFLSSLLIVGFLSVTAHAEKPTRFVAVLADGSRLQSNTLTDWQTVSSQPKLDGKLLFESKNALRWLRDRGLPAAITPRAYIETLAGDRLPGNVTGYRDGTEKPYVPAPAHFVVKPETTLQPPQNISEPRINVIARHVRRIVWQRRESDQLQPGTLFYRDGRMVTFRAARFSDGLITLLLADGQRKVYFAEIAEIHFPATDLWNAYLDELAVLSPRGDGRLLQVETSDGLIATTSLERFATSGSTNANDFGRWIHGIQPAWSLDILWVPSGNMALRRSFALHEVPLSRWYPAQSEQRSPLAGVGPPWRLNRNVQSGPLRSGGQEFGWGFGVHAFSELAFDLPPLSKSFRSAVGLDRIAGLGGCVRARVFAEDTKSAPLYESPMLVGSDKVEEIKNISLQGKKRLILQIDPAHEGRPAGADPLDIRDMTDWLDPLIELDAERLKRELRARLPKLIPSWSGWNLTLDQQGKEDQRGDVEWSNVRDENSPAPGSFHLGIQAKNKPFVLEREFTVSTESWLTLMAYQPVNTGQITKLEVRINGDTVQEFSLPVYPRGVAEPPPMYVSLRGYSGHTIKVQLVQMTPPAPAPILWRFIRAVDQLPTLFQAIGEMPSQGSGKTIENLAEKNPTLTGFVKLSKGEQRKFDLSRTIAIREMPQLGEFRYVHFSLRKSKGGQFALEYHDANGRDKPLRVDGGVGAPAFGSAMRMWSDPNSEQWLSIPRDLYSDFGKCDINALTLSCVAGDVAEFNSIFFARGREDFDLIHRVTLAFHAPQRRQDALLEASNRVLSGIVLLEFEDGRQGSGIIIDGAGTILTAGHLLVAPDKMVKIHIPDGPTRLGKTRGFSRDLDVGMVKFTETPHYRHSAPFAATNIPERIYYFDMTHKKSAAPGEPAMVHTSEIRRVFRNTIWTDFDPADWLAGGPLVDQHARTVGILSRRDPFGGSIYGRSNDFLPLLPRLEKGEVIGSWPRGAEPELGFTAKLEEDTVVVDNVASDSAAEKAGLQSGDILVKVNGRSIAVLQDVAGALAEKNAGDEVSIDLKRGSQSKSAKTKLAPRFP